MAAAAVQARWVVMLQVEQVEMVEQGQRIQ
jgi:hypothetical protein